MKRTLVLVLLVLVSSVSLLMAAGTSETSSSTRVAVVTPYMANATTAYVIEQFKADAEQKGWKVSVSDTAGDFGLLVSRIEDAVAQGVDAIVLGMGDPVQMTKGLDAAKQANIPVFGLDAGLVDGVLLNITSDNADLGRQTAKVLAEAMGGKGNVVMYTHDPHPGVRARAVGAAEVFASYPGIEVIQKVHIEVPGPVDNARKVTEDLITAKTPMQGIWAGWDEPAYGTTQALDASGVKTVKVVGIDGTDFAKGEIAKKGPFLATIEQDFDTMAATLVGVIADYFAGTKPASNLIQIPGNLIQ
ncbi:sugar ABC transporter substrate-binding protein [uncultured Sphaerochaeta sp.]|uniref:sugar ABC transporter substrate-binding protein n=1 Tax=uncultured Sphaerochaeta sp. TaxID=886478 RepID=UPI0029C9B684|nr:sugar ABC transporter substrate-binding protein [uncultured Sphaerochaeta sp.]